MITDSYHSNYIKIYFWQGTAFIMRFLSLFVVTPYLTEEPSIYGIYAVCISVTIFLNYADLGFLRAGQKYAAECYARGDRLGEIKFIGFGAFVLFLFTGLCTAVLLYFGSNPEYLIKGLHSSKQVSIASGLLYILAIFAPITVLQRMVNMVFDIRLDSYINQRLSLFASVITIGSAFYFFGNNKYEIISYFLFSQVINLFVIIISFYLVKRNYNYSLKLFFRNVRFERTIYRRANGLAYSGLYIMVMWILFYELDQFAIAKYLGVDKVAVYAVAFSFATLFRSIYGILFSPFMVRSNHFIGNSDDAGLKAFFLQLFSLSAPLVILPTVAFALIAEPLVLSWVGDNYQESVTLARLFPLTFILAFISYPASIMLTAKERIKEMYIIATIQPLVYWTGIVSTYSVLGLVSFGAFKFLATFISEIYCLYIMLNFLGLSVRKFFKDIIYPILLPLIFLIASLLIATNYLPAEKSKVNLIIVLATTCFCIMGSFLIQYFTSPPIRLVAQRLLASLYIGNSGGLKKINDVQ